MGHVLGKPLWSAMAANRPFEKLLQEARVARAETNHPARINPRTRRKAIARLKADTVNTEQIVALMRETADKRGCANFDVWAEAKTGDNLKFTLAWTGGRKRRIVFSGHQLLVEGVQPQDVARATLNAITSMDEELVQPKVKTTTPLHDAVFGMRA